MSLVEYTLLFILITYIPSTISFFRKGNIDVFIPMYNIIIFLIFIFDIISYSIKFILNKYYNKKFNLNYKHIDPFDEENWLEDYIKNNFVLNILNYNGHVI